MGVLCPSMRVSKEGYCIKEVNYNAYYKVFTLSQADRINMSQNEPIQMNWNNK